MQKQSSIESTRSQYANPARSRIVSNGDRAADNAKIAAAFHEAAELLALQKADPFRIAAYRKAAQTIAGLDVDIADIAARGPAALEALPSVGKGIAAAILELLGSGYWSQLERLRGALDPETIFQMIPGIGPVMAREIHDHLHIDTLVALEAAANDGRLAAVPGIGERRAMAIRHALSSMLSRRRLIRQEPQELNPLPVSVLLDVDQEYRKKAADGELRLIAPKRFNPENQAWLPILHTQRGPWHFTALFSNTARAHELGKTHDWVVLFYAADHLIENQCTVVTETSGPLKGLRVVRGREADCAKYWN